LEKKRQLKRNDKLKHKGLNGSKAKSQFQTIPNHLKPSQTTSNRLKAIAIYPFYCTDAIHCVSTQLNSTETYKRAKHIETPQAQKLLLSLPPKIYTN
jgi:hypothetical protein